MIPKYNVVDHDIDIDVIRVSNRGMEDLVELPKKHMIDLWLSIISSLINIVCLPKVCYRYLIPLWSCNGVRK